MRHPNELRAESSEHELTALGLELAELGSAQETMLVQLRLDEAERQAGGPDLVDPDLAQQVWQRADVILVCVREDDRAHRPLALAQVAEVREDQVDAEVLVPREREPGVDDDRVVPVLVDGHVLPDLAESAERDDSQRFWHRRSLGAGTSRTGRRSSLPLRRSETRCRTPGSVKRRR